MKKTYNIIDSYKYNPEKKNLLLFMLERNLSKKTSMLSYNYILNTVEVLQKDFNVFLIARSSSSKGTWIEAAKEMRILDKCIYINLDASGDFMKVNTGEKEFYNDNKKAYEYTYNYMQDLFTNVINGEPWIFENLIGTITSAVFLPYERNHEILPHDERTKKLSDGAMRTAKNRITGKQQVFSFRMISQRSLYPLYLLIRLMKERKDLFHYSFCHDTTSLWYVWSKKVNPLTKNVKCFYFVNDNRGPLRDFSEFPSGPIQDAYKKKPLKREELTHIINNKKKDFIWGGSFVYDVDYRLNDWTRFFENLKCNAIIRTRTDGTADMSTSSEIKDPLETKKFKGKKIKDEKALEVIRSISVNKNVKPTVSQEQYLKEQKEYLFTIILKCFYGKYDSLNFRVYSSLVNGIVPLVADDYDIDDLQIPKEFKQYITVSNNKDIEDKINWARQNPDKYKNLFWSMYNYYVKPEHFEDEWYRKVFKENYFNELYKK